MDATVEMSVGQSARKLETNAYAAILKAMCVTGLTWEREEFGTVAVGAERVERGTHADERTDGFGRGGAKLRQGYAEQRRDRRRRDSERRRGGASRVAAPRVVPRAAPRRKPQHNTQRAPKITPAQLAAMGVNEYICKKVKRFGERGWLVRLHHHGLQRGDEATLPDVRHQHAQRIL